MKNKCFGSGSTGLASRMVGWNKVRGTYTVFCPACNRELRPSRHPSGISYAVVPQHNVGPDAPHRAALAKEQA